METATLQISSSTHAQLRELAAQTGQSIQTLVEEAIASYRRLGLSKKAKAQSREETSTSQPVLVPDELAEDPNILAYKALDKAFLQENAGKFAAFCHGTLVALSSDRAELFELVRREHPDAPCLVKKLATEERVVRFRRPRRILKMDS